MIRNVILYGLLMAALVAGMKWIQYRFLIRELQIEVYIGIIAFGFTALGLWVGKSWFQQRIEIPQATPSGQDQSIAPPPQELPSPLSKREYEVLLLMAEGKSNQEIADQLFVSLSTVKTHAGNLFVKLDVTRRTQAILRARELGLLDSSFRMNFAPEG